MLHGKAERIDNAVVRRKINLPHASAQSRAARERCDRRSAVPEFLARLAVQSVKNRARRTPGSFGGRHLTVTRLKFAAGGYKDHAVDDRWRQRRDRKSVV